ncbi:hypothetical protein HPB47_020381 [Ixodes persulcatus]|uniref:Uncharacterized protein n=1 Tax=Ixodes persulcatus TaxID=34615 RepID=A0AC60QI66_IXOPE|nr:hypothetical protein HPB47_020381 [Ixodes persulcatus]
MDPFMLDVLRRVPEKCDAVQVFGDRRWTPLLDKRVGESATGVSPDSKLRWSTLSGDAQRQSIFAEVSSADYHISFVLQTSKNGRVPKANK